MIESQFRLDLRDLFSQWLWHGSAPRLVMRSTHRTDRFGRKKVCLRIYACALLDVTRAAAAREALAPQPLPSGPFVCPVLEEFWWLSWIRPDMRGASPRSAQPLPSGRFVCPVLVEVLLCESWTRLASYSRAHESPCLKCVSDMRLWQNAQASPLSELCFRHALVTKCTSKSPSKECFRLALVAYAQAGSCLKSVSDLRLRRRHKQVPIGTAHALRQSCERFGRRP